MTPSRLSRAERPASAGDSGPAGLLDTDPESRESVAGASGPFRMFPSAVARPRHVEDVCRLVEWAEDTGTALIPRGAGTGMPGGNVGRGVVLDLTGLHFLGDVEGSGPRATIRVGAGVVAARVQAAAAAKGLFLPPLPSSAEWCTVGGMIACNAAGARSFRWGATREWVAELEVVLSGGRRAVIGPGDPPPELARLHSALRPEVVGSWPRVRKNASGYALDRFLPGGDACHLLVGSEGTLGIVTGATLRLAPAPASRGVALLALGSAAELPAAAASAGQLGASACEVFGRRLIEMARLDSDPELGRLARDAALLLLVEVEGEHDEVATRLREVRGLGASRALTAVEPLAVGRLWEVRHRASPTIARAAERGLRSTQFIEDSVVPTPRVGEYLEGVEAILAGHGLDAVVFGHAGDGNLHVNPLVDVTRPRWREGVLDVLRETVGLVQALGGTLSGEHGDGRIRAPFLGAIWPESCLRAFEQTKRSLDPAGVFNPGVVLPLPGQDPLEGLEPRAASARGKAEVWR